MKKSLLWSLVASLLLIRPAYAEEWLAVRETSLEVQAGSPLDFSSILPETKIDENTRIVINPAGKLAMANDATKPQRFLCASLALSPASGGFPDHDAADRYALQLKRHGYNIARFHYVDAALMADRGKDFDFDPQVLDRVHYFMAALKRNGIYWIMDGLSSTRGAYGGYDDRWDLKGDLKVDAQIGDEGFNHWLTFQKAFFSKVNPYTGIAPIRDPALVAIVPFNENGLEFDSMVQEGVRGSAFQKQLRPLFNDWLLKKYGSDDALKQKWGWWTKEGSLEDRSVALPTNRNERSERTRDLQSFFIDVEQNATRRMTKALRDLGFRGIVLPYNNWPTIQTGISRSIQDAVAMNTYHDWVGSYEPGTSIEGKSSLEDGLRYLRTVGAARWLGRPFVITEYDHLFWNAYRYEAGLAAPAFAALQGWDVLCRHAHGPIVLAYGEDFKFKKQILPYTIALDPVARAGETLSALVFRRGDAKSAPLDIPFLVDGQKGLPQGVNDMEPELLTRLGLLGAIGLQSIAEAKPGVVAVDPAREGETPMAIVAELKQAGRLDPSSPSDLDNGNVVSQAGELQLDAAAKALALRTSMTEAVAFDKVGDGVELGTISVKKADGRGLLSLSSLDGVPLGQSKRQLLILASDARNSGMRFRDADQHVIENFGHLPVLIRRMTVGIRFEGPGTFKVSPVGLDGRVRPPVATAKSGETIQLSNDTPNGPTTYFLVERAE
ncbi:glycoside hydrolase [uncultured Agrobacterium sp.]|uniref:glycoside hydrolase n=1 Tax=uncultured Agrobacterium sp. TaxID=157277 RepID=UPI0025D83E62|nr:glycoside hydrolase [uncultured Agrobacterium sp.]